MTDHNSNPFVLPGMGQGAADAASNPLLASMEMMRQAWAGLTGPGGLAQVMPMTPPMNLQDLERRIAELRAVESWLRMNLSMLSSTIQGLEVQRSTIATLRSFVDNLGALGQDAGGASPLEIVLGLKPAPASAGAGRQAWSGEAARSGEASPSRAEAGARMETPADASAGAGDNAARSAAGEGAAAEEAASAGPSASAGSAQAINQAAQSASEAWWGMLQQQFNQLAAATAASMPGMSTPGAAASGNATPGAATGTSSGKAGSERQGAAGMNQQADRAPAASKRAAGKAVGAGQGAPRKTAVRKNKIQSDPDQS
ncbi:Transcriptional regulator [Bordetella sputigena]|uniref:PhaM family polyhydroxyalkanoate granule multifunctional regulatory protein n=1 Tax=Bordetella sputigena TaxID=1416810 RepID=UPI0039F11D9E